jgi:hypothetical protein
MYILNLTCILLVRSVELYCVSYVVGKFRSRGCKVQPEVGFYSFAVDIGCYYHTE